MLDWLAHRVISSPDRIALIYGDRRWRYAELNDLVAEMAGRLASAGVTAGDHVAVLMPNRLEYVCAIHALARLGAVLVPLNIRLMPGELCWQIDAADCTFLLCSRETETQAVALKSPLENKGHEQAGTARLRVLSVDRPRERGVEALGDQPAGMEVFRPGRPLDLEAVQGILFTSGTTGRPKGAMLTYRNHLASATGSAFRLGTLPGDRWLVCMPLYHVGGLAIILRCCLYGTTVVLQDRFDPIEVNQALDTQAITLISLVPTMLHRLLEARATRPFPDSLRCVLLGGAAAPATLLEQSFALGVPVATTYGLTEAASQVTTALPADVRRKAGSPSTAPRQSSGQALRQSSGQALRQSSGQCVGKPLMFSQVRIINDEGKEQPAWEVGHIEVRGPTVMEGYYRSRTGKGPLASRDALRGGWLHTGDMGYLDGEGDLWVVQRRSDLIVTGGENVYPVEVEGILLEHPGVAAACVVGIEDEEWGQRVAAAVVVAENTTLTEGELAAFCSARMAGYKRPRALRFVSSLPQTASGKVRRAAVAALFSYQENDPEFGE